MTEILALSRGVAPRNDVARAAPDKAPRIVSRDALDSALAARDGLPLVNLGELLVREQLVTPEQLDVALQLQQHRSDRRLGEILVELGIIQREDLYHVLCRKLGIPFVDVQRFAVDANALKALPDEIVRTEHILPLCYRDGALVVAVPDALNTELLKRLRFLVDGPVIPVMALAEDIQRVLGTYYGAHPGHDVHEIADQLRSELQKASEPEAPAIKDTDNTLVRLVNKLIVDAHAAGASDIHIESNPGRSNVVVRFRIDGELADYLRLPYNFRAAIVSRLKIMADIDISEHRRAQDGRINFRQFGPLDLELRVVSVPTHDGLEDIVLRLLSAREPLPIDKLGMPLLVKERLERLIEKPHGLILAVGPTGSGKTTTLHSLIKLINKAGTKIWTAENPIEISQEGLRQVQVNPKIGWDFATIMRAFLRADPDVIMVGEMRDLETAGIAVEASLTGHLVFSTLHTNSAAETVVRLLDIGVDPFSFSDSLLAVLAQRLTRRLCAACRTVRPAADAELSRLLAEYAYGSGLNEAAVRIGWNDRYAPLSIYGPNGCEACRGTGYRGRIGVYELLVVDTEMRQMMLRHASANELQAYAIAQGMRTLKQDGIEKCLEGITDIHEVRAVAM